jgi:outer membrane protein TolC
VADALKFAMGFPVGQPLSVSDNIDQLLSTYADADLSSQINFNARPEYTQLLKGRELSGVQVDLYSKPWMPTVVGFVQAQGSYQGNDKLFWIPSSVAGISVSLPIWDGGTTRAKRERAILSAQQVDVQRGMLENAITLEVEAARKQYLNAVERVGNQQKNLSLAQRIYSATETKYKAGIGSSFELVTAEQQVTTAQQNLLQAQYDLLSARVAVKKALGQL